MTGLLLILALLAAFALELTADQTSSRNEVTGEVHDRALLAGALINSLLGT